MKFEGLLQLNAVQTLIFRQRRRQASAISQRDPFEVCQNFLTLEPEGAGNAGRSLRPQPRMQNKKAYECRHHGHIGFTRHSPRDGFNKLPRALPGDQGLFDTVTSG